ncbi:MAG: hypothetical protein GY854_26660, partial [Deltaproteobacteria bacterium]|nr:hypothetical protein [Deltaproteobacteria bacterium]
AKVDKKYGEYHLVLNPEMADFMTENGTSRVRRIMRAYNFKINVIRDTTINQTVYRFYNAKDNSEITDAYNV